MCADLVELPMHDFDVILLMYRLHSYYAFLDCRIIWEGYNSSHPNPLVSNLKVNKMMSKGLLCHLMSVNDLDHYIPSIESAPVMNEFQDVFPDDFTGVPPAREIYFGIDLESTQTNFDSSLQNSSS